MRTTVLLPCPVPVMAPAITVHGKASLTGGDADRKEFRIFCIAFVQGDDAFTVIQFFHLIVDVLDIVTFIRKKGAFRNRQETVGFREDIQSNGGISGVGGGGQLKNGKTGNAVHKDMVFVTPEKLIILFTGAVGSGMYTKSAILIRLWLVIRMKFVREKGLGVVLGSIGADRRGIKADEGSVNDTLRGEAEDLGTHKVREDFMVSVFEEAVKGPVRRKRTGNIKTAVMGNKKVVAQIIDQIGDHGKTFTLHDNESTDHRMVRKSFAAGLREFLNGRKV